MNNVAATFSTSRRSMWLKRFALAALALGAPSLPAHAQHRAGGPTYVATSTGVPVMRGEERVIVSPIQAGEPGGNWKISTERTGQVLQQGRLSEILPFGSRVLGPQGYQRFVPRMENGRIVGGHFENVQPNYAGAELGRIKCNTDQNGTIHFEAENGAKGTVSVQDINHEKIFTFSEIGGSKVSVQAAQTIIHQNGFRGGLIFFGGAYYPLEEITQVVASAPLLPSGPQRDYCAHFHDVANGPKLSFQSGDRTLFLKGSDAYVEETIHVFSGNGRGNSNLGNLVCTQTETARGATVYGLGIVGFAHTEGLSASMNLETKQLYYYDKDQLVTDLASNPRGKQLQELGQVLLDVEPTVSQGFTDLRGSAMSSSVRAAIKKAAAEERTAPEAAAPASTPTSASPPAASATPATVIPDSSASTPAPQTSPAVVASFTAALDALKADRSGDYEVDSEFLLSYAKFNKDDSVRLSRHGKTYGHFMLVDGNLTFRGYKSNSRYTEVVQGDNLTPYVSVNGQPVQTAQGDLNTHQKMLDKAVRDSLNVMQVGIASQTAANAASSFAVDTILAEMSHSFTIADPSNKAYALANINYAMDANLTADVPAAPVTVKLGGSFANDLSAEALTLSAASNIAPATVLADLPVTYANSSNAVVQSAMPTKTEEGTVAQKLAAGETAEAKIGGRLIEMRRAGAELVTYHGKNRDLKVTFNIQDDGTCLVVAQGKDMGGRGNVVMAALNADGTLTDIVHNVAEANARRNTGDRAAMLQAKAEAALILAVQKTAKALQEATVIKTTTAATGARLQPSAAVSLPANDDHGVNFLPPGATGQLIAGSRPANDDGLDPTAGSGVPRRPVNLHVVRGAATGPNIAA